MRFGQSSKQRLKTVLGSLVLGYLKDSHKLQEIAETSHTGNKAREERFAIIPLEMTDVLIEEMSVNLQEGVLTQYKIYLSFSFLCVRIVDWKYNTIQAQQQPTEPC